jgi:DnaJ-class molecular chaperone
MGLFNSFKGWREGRREKRRANMESLGLCPDCGGRGFQHVAHSEAYYMDPLNCPGCDGSGVYSDWEENNFL